MLPTAAAFEHPEHAVERAEAYFAELDLPVAPLRVLHRTRGRGHRDTPPTCARPGSSTWPTARRSHLRSVLKDSAPVRRAPRRVPARGATIAASGAGATVLCDPMVDPRGGAYTVGLGVVSNLAVFPYHGSAADHIRERSIDLLPGGAVLAGIDASTALVREPDGTWRVAGVGRGDALPGPAEVVPVRRTLDDGRRWSGLPRSGRGRRRRSRSTARLGDRDLRDLHVRRRRAVAARRGERLDLLRHVEPEVTEPKRA